MGWLKSIFCKKKKRRDTVVDWIDYIPKWPPPPKHNKMIIDISFDFAKVYNVKKVDVVVGQKFKLFTDSGNDLDFYVNNDQVLNVDAGKTFATITATEIGNSKIRIFNKDAYELQDEIAVNIVAAIAEPAKDLGLSADEPVAK